MSEQRLAELERGLRQIEDERAIERLIASYGPRWTPATPNPLPRCGDTTASTT